MIKKKAVVYGRVSTERHEQEQSLDIQTIAMQEQCVADGYILEDTFAEKGSATKVRNRKKFVEMMKNCGLDFNEIQNGTDHFVRSKDRKPKYDIVYVKDTSRISRNTQQGIDIITQLKAQNVDVYFTNQFRKASEMDKDQIINMFNSAERESQAIGDRIRYSKRKLSEKNVYRPSVTPYGYMKQFHDETKETYTVVINPKERVIVEEMFDMYVNKNLGAITIANTLNSRSIPYKDNKRGWSDDKVRRMLADTVYYGSPRNHNITKQDVTEDYYTATNAKPIQLKENTVEGIISKETFEKAQEVKIGRTTNNGQHKHGIHQSKDNTYKSKLRCLHCGAPYVKLTNNKEVISYACRNKRKYGKDFCDSKIIRITQLNKYINASPIHLDYSSFDDDYDRLQSVFKKVYLQLTDLINVKEQQKVEISEQATTLMNTIVVVSNQPNSHMLIGDLTEQYNALKVQIEVLKSEIERISLDDVLELAEQVKSKFQQLMVLKENDDDSFVLSERIDVLKVVQIGKLGLKVTYNTPSFAEEIRAFNAMFESFGVRIDWFNPKKEELSYYYYRHNGKEAIPLDVALNDGKRNIEQDIGLNKLTEELVQIHLEDTLDTMYYEDYNSY